MSLYYYSIDQFLIYTISKYHHFIVIKYRSSIWVLAQMTY